MDPLGVSQIGSAPAAPLDEESKEQQHESEPSAPATPAKDWSPQKTSGPWHQQSASPARPTPPAVHVPPSPTNAWSQEQQQSSPYRHSTGSRPPHLQSVQGPGPVMPSPWSAGPNTPQFPQSASSSFQPQTLRTPSKEPRSPFSEDGARPYNTTRDVGASAADEHQGSRQQQQQFRTAVQGNRHADLQGREAAEALLERDRKHGFVRVKVLGLDRAKKDFFIKMEANTNLSTFHHSHIRPFSRALNEFVNLHTSLAANHPHLVLPALPIPATSAATEEEEDRLLKLSFQKWCDRITKQFDLVRDEELRNFLEADFSYQPTTLKRRLKAPAQSSFSLPLSRGKGTSDDDLGLIKQDMTKLEVQYNDTARAVDKDGRNRKLFSGSLLELSEQFRAFAATEAHPPLATGFRKMAEGVQRHAEVQSGFATAECVTLADALMYASNEAKEAKDALVQRQLIVEEQRSAAKTALTKQRAIEKIRNSGSIKQDRASEALEEYQDAAKHEKVLTQRLEAVSTKLQPSVIDHAKHMHEDLFSALLVHSKAGVAYERHALKDLEALRNDIKRIPPKRTEDAYIVHQPATTNPASSAASVVRAGTPSSAPPGASSYPQSQSPSLHSPRPRRSSIESGRPPSQMPGSPGRRAASSSSGLASPPPPEPVHAQSMFVPPTHRPTSAQQPGRINDLARSVVLVPGSTNNISSSSASGTGSAPHGQRGGGTAGRRGIDDRTRVDAKMAASKLATMFNN